MIAHRIVASLTIALALVSLAIPEAHPAEQRKRMVIKAKKPVDRKARHAREVKYESCVAACYQDCRK